MECAQKRRKATKCRDENFGADGTRPPNESSESSIASVESFLRCVRIVSAFLHVHDITTVPPLLVHELSTHGVPRGDDTLSVMGSSGSPFEYRLNRNGWSSVLESDRNLESFFRDPGRLCRRRRHSYNALTQYVVPHHKPHPSSEPEPFQAD